ncbi:MAG: TolC family protein [Planctomycetota bacterium]|nr:TolC family protein [Planctomycetota bacterium]
MPVVSAVLALVGCFAAQEPGVPEAPVGFPLRLEDAIRLVHEHGSSLQQARLRALAENAGIGIAEGAYDPTLFADLTWSYSEQPAGGFFSSFGTTTSRSLSATQGLRQALMTGGSLSLSLREAYNDYSFLPDPQSDASVNLEYRQPLLRGAWQLSATQELEQARFSADRAQADMRQADSDVVQLVVDKYWDLAFALADVEVKQRSLALAQALKEMTEAKFRVGAVSEVEVVQTDADIATRTDALLGARHRARNAQDELRIQVFGLENAEEWGFDLTPSSLPVAPGVEVPTWEETFAEARAFRGDLRKLRVDVEASLSAWDAAKHDLMPTLDLTATANYSAQDRQVGDSLDLLLDRDFPGATVGIVFEMPIGNRSQEGMEQRARWNYWLAQRGLRDTENTVALQAREAVRNTAYQAERVAVTDLAREVAGRQLEAEQRRLREGASTNFQVLQFQTDLAAAESAAAQARMDYAKSVVRLNTVRGLNWDGSRPDLAHLEQYQPDPRFGKRESAGR